MTPNEASVLAYEWRNLLDEARCEDECDCHSAAEDLNAEALAIEVKLNAAGYNPADILRKNREST